jgi:GT2 family glycosyltransferase
VTVIVSALQAADQIRDCILSLLALDYPRDRHEIVVVDAGSTDDTQAIVRRYPVRLVESARRNISVARNAGIQAAQGDILAFTDTDCVVSAGWLRALVTGFESPDVGAVAGGIVPYPPRTSVELYAARRRSHSQVRPLAHPVRPFALTPNVAFSRDVFRSIGGFDARFPGGGWEDADLCWRLRRETRLRLTYCARAVVFHRYRTTPREFFGQHFRYGHGLGLLLRKYRGELENEADWAGAPRMAGALGTASLKLARAAISAAVGRGAPHALAFAWFDLLREAGQRSGFLRAQLSHVASRRSAMPEPASAGDTLDLPISGRHG